MEVANKDSVRALAVFDGPPLFEEPIHVNRPNAGDLKTFVEYVEPAWKNRYFTNNGDLVRTLEHRLCERLGVAHCVLTCNGTIAMLLAVRALALQGEVILPAFNFLSTAHVLTMFGITPVFADIDPRTWTIDPEHCRDLMSARTTAIIGTHIWGRACDIAALEEVRHGTDVKLLFDAAHAFGCSHGGTPLGRFGTAEVFSFHATKAFHTFEGGAVTTDDAALAESLRKLRNFGFSGYDMADTIGLNAKMSEIHAAMGLLSLDTFDAVMAGGHKTFQRYCAVFETVPGLTPYPYPGDETLNHHYVPMRVSEDEFGLDRDTIIELLHAEGILARRYFYPGTHRLEAFRDDPRHRHAHLPQTDLLSREVLILPGGASATEAEVETVARVLRFLQLHAPEIRQRLDLSACGRRPHA